ncbi:ABC-F type ribosomal protection protein [Alkalihalobacillus oceani]|uniref:Vga family ABC-F type ribosomal protection protein n=1 Tax=Halalkalibacter oceani TaxID=1653776 RepID=UPI0020410B34|nr:ABC-F type ribosomal protection protein [Halalkalibacter oceani]MCM3761754.1 ABC-F type ribosomal protection protein [Halalkalibacter oceani]
MHLIEAQHVKLYAKDRLLLDIERLQIEPGDRIGLVGRNGCGKTTFLRALAGERQPDEGQIKASATRRLLPQLKHTNTHKSGGEVTQAYIQEAVAAAPALLLADEPTTNLDTAHIEWIESILRDWQGAFILVSHDRAFLDALCTKIWEIEDGQLTEFKGNYSDYAEQKELQRRSQQQAYEQYQKKKRQLEEALKEKERKAARATKKPKKVSASEAKITGAKPYFAKKQKKLQQNAKAIETRIEQLEKVEKVKDLPTISMQAADEPALKKQIIIRAEQVEGVVGGRTLWKKTSFYIRGGDKLAILGANGSGKTTLVKKMISGADGITISPSIRVGYFSQNLSTLDTGQTVLANVSENSPYEESFIRTMLARLLFFREDVLKPVSVLSGGERVKVALAKLLASGCQALILDEPTNYLDIASVEALESLLKEFSGTVIFVSHDRQFVANIATRLLIIENRTLAAFDGSYHDYREVQVKPPSTSDADELLVIEQKITEVLSRLSLESSDELEAEFQRLLQEKRRLTAKRDDAKA